eukprot:TRINITY_DN2285_c0_g1_i4.p1 TRINITY_DN2285_c0_g1~~TRINITY_DN2285_c0_g1_i4.p1  ORF type:complete len:713 (-),score=97.20 TRINITY_DN2285_c0_g1_i4:142-2280(-)
MSGTPHEELLSGEELLKPFAYAVSVLSQGGSVAISGGLWVSNYRLIFSSQSNTKTDPVTRETLEILLHSIHGLSNTTKDTLAISSHVFRVVTFKFQEKKTMKEFMTLIKANIYGYVGIKRAFCYSYRPRYTSSDYVWWDHMPLAELARLGISNNTKWKLCSVQDLIKISFPAQIFVPNSTTNHMLADAMKTFEGGHLPVILYQRGYASLLVSSRYNKEVAGTQIILGPLEMTVKSKNPNMKDKKWTVVDVFSHANYVAPYPWEDIEFFGLPAIPVFCKQFEDVGAYVHQGSDKLDINHIRNGWLQTVNNFGIAANKVVKLISEEITVLVRGHSKNRIQTGVATLAQILLDPFYRTIMGFCILIEKDWVSFAYQFYAAAGITKEQHPPVWSLFLNALSVIIYQYPSYFEYNAAFLLWLEQEVVSTRFGTFCYESTQGNNRMKNTPVAWNYVLASENLPRFKNRYYEEHPGILYWSSTIIPFLSPSYVGRGNPHTDRLQLKLENAFSENTSDTLDLSKHRFFKMPPFASDTVKELDISGNLLESLPACILDFPMLTKIDISSNPLAGLYPSFMKLVSQYVPHLETLVMNRNSSSFPTSFGPIKHLYWDDARPVITGEKMSEENRLETVQLRNCALTHLPPNWDALTSITHLNLYNNNLSSISLASSFVKLKLANNKLSIFLIGLDKLSQLTHLDLRSNQLLLLINLSRSPSERY